MKVQQPFCQKRPSPPPPPPPNAQPTPDYLTPNVPLFQIRQLHKARGVGLNQTRGCERHSIFDLMSSFEIMPHVDQSGSDLGYEINNTCSWKCNIRVWYEIYHCINLTVCDIRFSIVLFFYVVFEFIFRLVLLHVCKLYLRVCLCWGERKLWLLCTKCQAKNKRTVEH